MLTETHIRDLALQIGFDDCATAVAARLDDDAAFMEQWLSQGYAGDMTYLHRHREQRYDIRALVPGATTVVSVVLTYEHSGRDYHRTVKSLLYELRQSLIDEEGEQIVNAQCQHIFCDSAPVLERAWAVRAGLGRLGRNHQLIHPTLGSMVHLGELVLNAAVLPDAKRVLPAPLRICDTCLKCVTACPNQALSGDWNATRCVAYLTHKCVQCQQVCPYNETVSSTQNCSR